MSLIVPVFFSCYIATDKDKFVNQKHKICGSFAEVSIANLSSTNCLDSSEDDGDSDNEDSTNCHSDIIPDMLEVTCHEKHFDTEILEMYFSGKKSGGRREKEIESVEEIENRIYHVKFESEEGIGKRKSIIDHLYSLLSMHA